MLFNSFQFLVFFPVVTLLYFLAPHKFRWIVLLVASCVFYTAFIPVYILILLFTIVIDYIAGIVIENSEGKKRKLFLILSIVANVGVLAIFKYYNFFITNINEVLQGFNITTHSIPFLGIILPIGLSFHTFQAMSYTIEVYRGHQKAEKHFGIYALYVMFYPQLVAGPIERPQNILHQFYEKHNFNRSEVVAGLQLMLWGLFKKIVIADRLANITEPVFHDIHHYPDLGILAAVLVFPFQIFCDFSGYSDIALGASQVMGFKLMQNFNQPYHSRSISEFWSRWHISLSTWFRDYLYISLGGNRVSVPRWYFNLFFVFLVSGFWHGASWTFILWGALHGFYSIFATLTEKSRKRMRELTGLSKFPAVEARVQVIITFVLVSLAWIFFRANSVKDAVYAIKRIPGGLMDMAHLMKTLNTPWFGLSINNVDVVLAIVLIAFLEGIHLLRRKRPMRQFLNEQNLLVRLSIYYSVIIAILALGVFENRQFIYFQF